MDRTFYYTVSDTEEGMKLGDFLRTKGFSRHILTLLKNTEQGILLNGSPAFSSRILKKEDRLQVLLTETEGSKAVTPVHLSFDIVYEDEDLLVVNKPADMPIHPSFQNYGNTLANGLSWYFAQKGETFVYRCINRLDRDTTGLLIVAKHLLSASILSRMAAARQIHREYLAVVQGIPPEEGEVNAPIGRKPGSALERCVDFSSGEEAVTHYRCLESREGLSLVSLSLETGRTHQIRVHMGYLGHPLIGDYLYNPDTSKISRQALHSHKLSFLHPITRELLSFTAPLPKDMAEAFYS